MASQANVLCTEVLVLVFWRPKHVIIRSDMFIETNDNNGMVLDFHERGVSIDIETGFRTAFRHFWSFVVSPLRRTSHVEKGIPQNLGGKHCTRAPYKSPYVTSCKQSTLGAKFLSVPAYRNLWHVMTRQRVNNPSLTNISHKGPDFKNYLWTNICSKYYK